MDKEFEARAKAGGQPKQEGRVTADSRIVSFRGAANIFCKRMGINPNGMIQVPHPTVAGVMLNIPLWYSIAGQMFELATMLQSMREGKEKSTAANDEPLPDAATAPQESSLIIKP